MKNNKGITLISLIASIILLIILATTTISTSMNAYKQMKFEGAKSELEEVEKITDEIATDYQTYLKENNNDTTKTYVDYFIARYNKDFTGNLISSNEDKISDKLKEKHEVLAHAIESDKKDVFYFTADNLKATFGLKGIDPVVIDFSTRIVYSVEGIKDSGNDEIYYTSTDWGEKPKITQAAQDSFTISAEQIEGAREVKISTNPTKVALTVSEVYIKLDSGNWIKTDDFRDISSDTETLIRVPVKTAGTYTFKIVDELNNSYETTTGLVLN